MGLLGHTIDSFECLGSGNEDFIWRNTKDTPIFLVQIDVNERSLIASRLLNQP